MDLLNKLQQIERLDRLIRLKSTGNAQQLSERMNISERQVYNILNTMKSMGAPIYFCQSRMSYCYESNVMFSFGFISKDDPVLQIKGGAGVDALSFYLRMNFNCY